VDLHTIYTGFAAVCHETGFCWWLVAPRPLPGELMRSDVAGAASDQFDGPLESAKIRCPRGHWFNGPIASLVPQERHGCESGPGMMPQLTGSSGARQAHRRPAVGGQPTD